MKKRPWLFPDSSDEPEPNSQTWHQQELHQTPLHLWVGSWGEIPPPLKTMGVFSIDSLRARISRWVSQFIILDLGPSNARRARPRSRSGGLSQVAPQSQQECYGARGDSMEPDKSTPCAEQHSSAGTEVS